MNCNCPNVGACDGSCAPYNQPTPMAAQTAPERIYLVIGEDCPQDITFRELCSRFDDGVTWCEDKIDENSIGYVRADIQKAAQPAALVPADFLSHKSAWRNALSQCARSAKGTDDESYWAHELAAFDRAYAELGA
jgi:hypothetical protein